MLDPSHCGVNVINQHPKICILILKLLVKMQRICGGVTLKRKLAIFVALRTAYDHWWI